MTFKFIDATIPKFILVGICNTVIGAGTMFLLYNYVHFSYWGASVANYVVGGLLSFFLNKYFTFKNKEKSAFQAVKFLINIAICYFVGFYVSKCLSEVFLSNIDISLRENIAMCLGMCLYTILNYIGQRFWTFR